MMDVNKHLDVEMPQVRGLAWVLSLVKLTWPPMILAVVCRWLSSALEVLSASLIAFVVVQLGNSQQTGLAIPAGLRDWLINSENPVRTTLMVTLGFVVAAICFDLVVAWTKVWVHLIINKRLTPQVIDTAIRVNPRAPLDAPTAVQRWLLKIDIVYFLHESIAATLGHLGTMVIALVATYHANITAGNVALGCLALWLTAVVPLTIMALRTSRKSALAHERVGRIIRDSIALRADLSRPSLIAFWLRRSSSDVAVLQAAIARQGLWALLLEDVLSAIARIAPIVAVLVTVHTANDVASAIAILLYLTRLAGPLRSLAGIFPWLQQNLISVQRVYQVVVKLHQVMTGSPGQLKVQHTLSVRTWAVRVSPEQRIDYPEMSASSDSILCILGPSGSGKSTLLRSIAGHQLTESGELLLDGVQTDVHSGFWQETCSLVPQQPELIPGTVQENLDAFPTWKPTDLRQQAATQVLGNGPSGDGRSVGIDEPGVSVGQRRAIAVLRSIGADAQVILLDEPIAGLDDSLAQVMREVIEEARREGRIIILTAHEHDFQRLRLPAARVVRLDQLVRDDPKDPAQGPSTSAN